MRMVFLFGVPFILVLLGFGFLLKKEYGWIKNCDENTGKLKQFVLWLSTIGTALVGFFAIMVIGTLLLVAVSMQLAAMDQAKIVNLNNDTEPLSIGETWVIEDKGFITVNSFVELSDEELQEKYRRTAEESKKYYEISFDYKNIAFDGYLQDKKLIKNDMCVSVYVSSRDVHGEMMAAMLDTYGEKTFYYAPRGSVVRDNRFLIAVNDVDDMHAIEMSFTILTPDKYEIYRQHYLYEVLKSESYQEDK